jgi:hypothetical protein
MRSTRAITQIKPDLLLSERRLISPRPTKEGPWDRKVNKYLYQKSLTNEVVYQQDLRTRSGEQYFEQLMRDRHKEEMKPKPYLYVIKNKLWHENLQFVNYIRRTPPPI